MKAKKITSILVVLLLAVATLAPLAAQQIYQGDTYTVKPGDNAWKIAGENFRDPLLWKKIVERNPFLREKGRITVNPANGWTYVMMHPGEQLAGLVELGIVPEIIPADQLPVAKNVVEIDRTPVWIWWPLIAAIILLIGLSLIYWILTRDPATAREPIVPGGVTAETAPARFQESARINLQRRTEQYYSNNQFTVLSSVLGRIWGIMNVQYADGSNVPRRLDGQEAFRALVRMPDGKEETLYMLQACGNDLRFGGISRYLPGPDFRFEANGPAVTPAPLAVPEVPAPAPVVEPVAALVAEPAAATRRPTPQPGPNSKMFIAFVPGTDGNNNMLRWKGMTPVSLEEDENGIGTFRFITN